MDREDIIRLAREVGYPLVEYEGTPYIPPLLVVLLETVAAAQRTWVGLTDEEIEQSCVPLGAAMLSFTEVARAIEAKLRSKNEDRN